MKKNSNEFLEKECSMRKKLVALMLSTVLVVSMSIPAFASAVPNADEFNVDSHYTRVTSISEDCGVCVLDNSPTNLTELELAL